MIKCTGKKHYVLLAMTMLLMMAISSVALAADWSLAGDIGAHDPALTKEGNTWWLFHTGTGIPVKYSGDGVNWTQGIPIFSSDLSWWANYAPNYDPDNSVWAPDIEYYNGRWWLYYSVSEFGTRNSAIGLVSASSIATGDWREDGMVISSSQSGTSYNAIDPNLIIDSSNNPWLVFGSWSDGIHITRVDKNTMKPTGTIYSIASRYVGSTPAGLEGANITYHDGYYYLFASIDKCCKGVESDYKIVYGRSSNITGPYIDRNGIDMRDGGGTVLTASDSRYKGHGGQDVYNNLLVHHAYDANNNGAPVLRIKNLYWSNGWPTLNDGYKKGFYKLQNRNSGKYLEVASADIADGANIQQWGDTGHATQEWMLYPIGGGYYRLQNRNSLKYLEVANADTADGANIQQWENTAHATQEWQLVNVGNGYYKLINRNSGKAIEVYNLSTEDGGNVAQWTDLGGTNQQWKLIWVSY
ncbi:arabinan endo-1,5-alpha-L-arabinosidase [Orenia metallireducens]|uniref:Arabinan endo-1,5-alpha-L-arabinosidase n=1 Tax=Orenia metallireducens TaxID=1413210 RepID=A0A285I9P5_9FIRM|nr:family 43 glycosylhydrolase [Orenia metallireducens]PRX20670.1 arabinan endo-1,5-alpha-L-arabinosidase [Orenia metallireducens]SNY44702.1 arabinan endo-1,5-alpha-L-arabinosidase [Orenia metallireducens]